MPTMTSSPWSHLCSSRNWWSMSLTACERLSKPRTSTMRSRSLSKSSGSDMLILLTGRLRVSARMMTSWLIHIVGDVGGARHHRVARGLLVIVRLGLVDQLLEPRFGGEEGRRDQLREAARPRHRHLDQFPHLARMRRQDQDAIGEEDRLVEIVGDEHDGDVDLAPDFEQMRLHPAARLRVDGV